RLVERWIGREWDLRRDQAQAFARIQAARKEGDVEETPLSYGQDAGLIHDILPAGEIVRRIAEEAETILTKKISSLVA
ncbi:MAG: nitronate monooxygenase, partial [Alphaproteobacteria bacterium]|nr:nitronate monooxygenase [Alphaproteobacteria bacterium]